MLLEPAPAAAATGCHYATAAATASATACPRLTGGAVVLKDSILDYRSNGLIAIDRGTGGREEGADAKSRAPISCRTGGIGGLS